MIDVGDPVDTDRSAAGSWRVLRIPPRDPGKLTCIYRCVHVTECATLANDLRRHALPGSECGPMARVVIAHEPVGRSGWCPAAQARGFDEIFLNLFALRRARSERSPARSGSARAGHRDPIRREWDGQAVCFWRIVGPDGRHLSKDSCVRLPPGAGHGPVTTRPGAGARIRDHLTPFFSDPRGGKQGGGVGGR